MPRAFTRAQALQNRVFLAALGRTGNAREAARRTDIAYGTIQHRRRVQPAFAQAWDAALATAQARLARGGPARPVAVTSATDPNRTRGGEPVVIRRADGGLQVRRAQPGKLTRACEQAFLRALAATCNVRLAAAAVGTAEAAFYRRRRRDPGFEREWRLALAEGYERIECALLSGWAIESHERSDWRHNEPAPIPPMSPAQALQLLYLHQKEARLGGTPEPMRRRRGESPEVEAIRLTLLGELRLERDREEYRLIEAARAEARARQPKDGETPPALPALDQVAGWSKASGRAAHHPDVALFGGWRMRDLKGRG
ncbi:hypothetical protein [uncultured Sphingomonas sp.]|uniref:hypothetical protein n=1 Tax=uncultured Sphingomonas sp. TaxID=158754 RepID=UPI0035CBF8F1